ncbi:MAG: TolC family protein [Proteobacteria bacterium]|nr:TolC family protein [Cystobacterineae bacterium]MCL2258434.1 TolC family protein [Cystobacterineae bacterium]MCL2315227.1 TolC family protein [Pseudomonadota bacterium]
MSAPWFCLTTLYALSWASPPPPGPPIETLENPSAQVLTLEAAVQRATQETQRSKLTQEQEIIAQAATTKARAFFFPTLRVAGNYTHRAFETINETGGRRATIQAKNALFATANIQWTLLDIRGIPLYRAAFSTREAGQLEARNQRRLNGMEAADAFLQTLTAQSVEEAARHRIELAEKNLSVATSLHNAGLVSLNDITRAKLEKANAETSLETAVGVTLTTKLRLATLLDLEWGADYQLLSPEGFLHNAENQKPLAEQPPIEEVLENRLDFLALEQQAQAAKFLAQEPWMRLLPTLSLIGQGRLTNETGLNNRKWDGSVGLELSWTLFDGGLRYGDWREKRAQAQIASIQTELQRRQIRADLQIAFQNMHIAQTTLSQAKATLALAEQNIQETTTLYHQGLTTALQLLDASVQKFEADVNFATQRYALGLALVNLYSVAGMDALGRKVEL